MINKIKFALSTALLASGIANAGSPCEGFKINLENKLQDNFVVRKMHIDGAEFAPSGIQAISGNSTATFTINKAVENRVLKAKMILDSLSVPVKEVRIEFDLDNSGVICNHKDHSTSSKSSISHTRVPGVGVNYTINN